MVIIPIMMKMVVVGLIIICGVTRGILMKEVIVGNSMDHSEGLLGIDRLSKVEGE
jgi:hypothetical protein